MKKILLLTTSLTTCSFLALGLGGLGGIAYANPEGGVVAAGQASISSGGTRVDVHQSSDKAVIDWRSFNINQGETTQFHQPSSSSLTVNRINDANPSKILGNLSANGNLVLINQAGVMFGKDAVVDVNGLIATTSNISNANAMAGNLTFDSKGQKGAKVINDGTITAKQAGLVGLVAPHVENNGVINAKLGKVHLGSAESYTLDLYGDGALAVAASEEINTQLISNKGQINAEGGIVQITAAAGANLVSSLIQIDGEINTPQINAAGGKITISGNDATAISITGTLDASGTTGGTITASAKNILQQGTIKANGTNGQGGTINLSFKNAYLDNEASKTTATGSHGNGGTIKVIGQENSRAFLSGQYDASSATHQGGKIEITTDNGDLKLYGAKVTANGKTQGGKINIGGEYQGTGTLKHAKTTAINYATTISADATDTGAGGSIVVWSKDQTLFGGTAQARGGINGGNGGLIEISSKDTMKIAGNATTTAAARKSGYTAGTLLLDPKNITIATGGLEEGGISYFKLIDPNADAGDFGGYGGSQIYTLSTGNIVVIDQSDDFAATNAGAVYLFNGATGSLISTVTGSQADDYIGDYGITMLTNGNYVIRSDYWANGAASSAGAATWGSGITGVSGVVSAANSLVGTHAYSYSGGFVTALSNGNYLVLSSGWGDGTGDGLGAVTWGNGATGISGIISSANSLVGSTAYDFVGDKVTILSNGNYVVASSEWDNGALADAGAVTWGSAATGVSGVVSSSNSLVGSKANDMVGYNGGIIALTNGNYVITSMLWDNGATVDVGAVTWANGTTGITGTISAANSLIGSTAQDRIGSNTSNVKVYELSNGNYVINSPYWNNGATIDVGASTWGNGLGGTVGTISAANSLIGSTAYDLVGNEFTALTNGNYVVISRLWNRGAVADVGAVTWGNGLGGTVGVVSISNSLVGSTANDQIGTRVTALTNGNYVLGNWSWDNGGIVDAGSVTWANGLGGTVGAVSSANSLVGSTTNDRVGEVYALATGNYIVRTSSWDRGGIANAGAVTFGNGLGGTVGVITTANSLVGSTANDMLGSGALILLNNGNYVVGANGWDNGAIVNAGAVTWGNGTSGTVGVITSANSLVGSTANDALGGMSDVVELANGNYVVLSKLWDNGALVDAGAVTWGNGLGGTVGALNATNSLVGSSANDQLGNAYIQTLSNGNYLFASNLWNNGAIVDAGAVTMGNGNGGTVGFINNRNSLIGTTASGQWIVPNLNASMSTAAKQDTVNNRTVVVNQATKEYFLLSRDFATLGMFDSYADMSGLDVTLSPDFITGVLNAGTSVVLQANNDITVNNNIIANNVSGDGGDLTLQAGRSILINANIFSDNGNVYLLGNQKLVTGVVNAYRDAGNAVITMATGTSINAGTGDVVIRLDDGAGLTHHGAGNISLEDITASSILVQNVNATGDVVLNAGSNLSGTGTGDAITLVSNRNFINNGATLTTASGRWLVYSTDPADDTLGGLVRDFRRFSCTYGGSCPSFASTGNGLMYRITPVLTVTPDAVAIQYGDSLSLSGYAYNVSGYLDTDDESDDGLSGSLTGTTAYTVGSGVGSYDITYGSGTLTSALGYSFVYDDNATAITVNKKDITASFNAALTKTYGNANPTIDYNNFSFSGLVGSDSASLFTSVTPNFGTVDANTSVSTGNAVTATIGSTANYNITNTPATTLAITARALTVTTDPYSINYGDVDPVFTGSNNLTAHDAALISWLYAPSGYSGNAGTYTVTATATDASSRLSNYSRTNSYGNFTVISPTPPTPTPSPSPVTALPDTVIYMGLGGYLYDEQAGTSKTKDEKSITLENEMLEQNTAKDYFGIRMTKKLKDILNTAMLDE